MTDEALMPDTIAEAGASFEDIMRERSPQILRIAYRILGNWADAEDAAQDVFVRLFRHGLNFPTEAAQTAWLCRVAVNLCIDRTRTRRPTAPLLDDVPEPASAESDVLRAQEKQRLMQALAKLPARERAAVILREIEGFSAAETAAMLGSTDGTVRSQISKAIGRLRTILTRRNDD